jgi:hypothetical protein
MSFIKGNLNWIIFITIIILLVIAKVSMLLDDPGNQINIKIIKESFGMNDEFINKLNKMDKQLTALEFKMIPMKEPVTNNLEPPKEKKKYINSSTHYY